MQLTDEQRQQIVLAANTNILVGLMKATEDQMLYIEKQGLKGKRKMDFQILTNSINRYLKGFEKEGSPEEHKEVEGLSDEIHDLLFKVREKTVDRYEKYVLNV